MSLRYVVLTVVLLAPAPAAADDSHCRLTPSDRNWLEPALTSWTEKFSATFSQAVDAQPLLIVLGRDCVWATGQSADRALGDKSTIVGTLDVAGQPSALYGASHGETFRTPSGDDLKASPLSYTTLDAAKRYAYFTIANTEIWHDAFPQDSASQTNAFLRGVATHELVHTQQTPILLKLDALSTAHPELGDISDEMFQSRYGREPGYAEAMSAQKRALIAALHERDPVARRHLALAIVHAYRDRQAHYFGEKLEVLRQLEDELLTLEGVAVWFSFQAAPPPGTGGDPEAIASYYERGGGGGSWVQLHGALFAALLDSFGGSWRHAVFALAWRTLPEELERAVLTFE